MTIWLSKSRGGWQWISFWTLILNFWKNLKELNLLQLFLSKKKYVFFDVFFYCFKSRLVFSFLIFDGLWRVWMLLQVGATNSIMFVIEVDSPATRQFRRSWRGHGQRNRNAIISHRLLCWRLPESWEKVTSWNPDSINFQRVRKAIDYTTVNGRSEMASHGSWWGQGIIVQ